MQKVLLIVAVGLGIVFIVAAGFYAALPAHNLPHFFPGYALNTKHHFTHAVASLFLSFACFAYVWFATGKKSSSK